VLAFLLRYDHVALLLFGLVAYSLMVRLLLHRADKNLLFFMFTHFECWYLVFFTFVYLIFGTWGLAANGASPTFVIEFMWIATPLYLLSSIIIDVVITRSPITKPVFLFLGTLVSGFILIHRLIRPEEFAESTVCLYHFCTDSAHLSYIGVGQVCLYLSKYFVRTVIGWRANRQEFVIFRLPVTHHVYLEPEPGQGNGPVEIIPSMTTLRIPIERQIIELRAQAMEAYFQSCPLITTPDTHAHFTHVTQLFRFRPLVSWRPLVNIGSHPYYFYVVVVYLLLFVALNFPPVVRHSITTSPVVAFFVCLPSFLFWAVELIRYDMTILSRLSRTFNWLVLLGLNLQILVFGIWSTSDQLSLLPFWITWLLFNCLLCCCLDAGVSYPHGIRVLAIILRLLNDWRIFFLEIFYESTLQSHPVCFYFCGDTRILYLSGVFSAHLFFWRYVVTLIRWPAHCMALSVPLTFCWDDDLCSSDLIQI
jgi:hypothetical protein